MRGIVYNDVNRDGAKQVGEAGIEGIPVRATALDGDNAGQYWETQSLDNGSYVIFLPPGEYLAEAFGPSSWIPTTVTSTEFSIVSASVPVQIDFGYRQADTTWLPLIRSR
ncbi:MAG: hypothetical protein KDH89_15705 [Anaerolineae bacterium]|nr:hypothetical protein [Anaerolineae bacterium]